MINRVILENKLVQEIHNLPIEAIESLLKLALLIKSNQQIKANHQPNNFVDFIRNSPLMDTDLDLKTDSSLCRDIEL